MALIVTLIVIAAVLLLALGLAWVPMRLLVAQMARNVRQFIQRQRERRAVPRETPDRRKAPTA
jgi:1,4-dihydroxy-2-naphthoate octaprenyltransferase